MLCTVGCRAPTKQGRIDFPTKRWYVVVVKKRKKQKLSKSVSSLFLRPLEQAVGGALAACLVNKV